MIIRLISSVVVAYFTFLDLDKSVDDYEREAQLGCEYEALMKKRETLLRIREEINSM